MRSQQRLDEDPQAMRRRRETVEHPFGTFGSVFMMKCVAPMRILSVLASEMALHALAYNMTRVMNIIGSKQLLAAIRA